MPNHLAIALRRTWKSDCGSEVIEFVFVLLPMLAILFLIIDISWMLFAKVCLQEAAREGVRYGVTGRTMNGKGLIASVQTVVQQNSLGFVSPSAASSVVQVQFFSQNDLSTPVTGVSSTAGGNVIQVTVQNVSVNPLMPLLRSANPFLLYATSSDVMESSPGGIPPNP
jgi:Flp pilus assembly protein TadG